jgi:hypothetical protein
MASKPNGEVTGAAADVDGTRCVCDEGGVRLRDAWLSAGVFLCVASGQGGGWYHRRSGSRWAQRHFLPTLG